MPKLTNSCKTEGIQQSQNQARRVIQGPKPRCPPGPLTHLSHCCTHPPLHAAAPTDLKKVQQELPGNTQQGARITCKLTANQLSLMVAPSAPCPEDVEGPVKL